MSENNVALTTGAPAPEFHIPAVTRQNETLMSLADYRASPLCCTFIPKMTPLAARRNHAAFATCCLSLRPPAA